MNNGRDDQRPLHQGKTPAAGSHAGKFLESVHFDTHNKSFEMCRKPLRLWQLSIEPAWDHHLKKRHGMLPAAVHNLNFQLLWGEYAQLEMSPPALSWEAKLSSCES